MLKNYFKIALRNLRLYPGYTFINLSGLAIGMACCLLIMLYLQNELGYDQYHEKKDRIYRVVLDYKTGDVTKEEGYTQGMLAPTLMREIPEVEHAIRMIYAGGLFAYEDKQFSESSILMADAGFFNVFSFDLLRGNKDQVLANPKSIVLTEVLAKKYFGDVDPVGKLLQYNNAEELTVTGVVKTPPAQSHFTFDGLISMSTLDNEQAQPWMFSEWLSTFVQTYVLLREGASPAVTLEKIAGLSERVAGDMMRESNRWLTFHLEPLTTIYLASNRDGLGSRGSNTNLYLFGFVAGFILLIACINFMNLATARAMMRAREIGVRKTLGAARMQLVWQFMGEAFMYAVLAMGLSLVLVSLGLPAFNLLAGKSLVMDEVLSPRFFIWAAAFIVIVTLLAGSYPALVLSGFKPLAVLKGKAGDWKSGESMRKGLVVFQFAVSVALIIATAVVYIQLQYMKNEQLGFDKEQVLLLDFGGDPLVQNQVDRIKNEMKQVPGVMSISASQTIPGWGLPQSGGAVRMPDGTQQDISVGLYMVDYDFVDLFKLDIVAGRAFSPELASDSLVAYILNETAVKQLGLTGYNEALGLDANFWGNEGQIVGVTRDIHHYALQTQVKPMAVRIDYNNLVLFSIRVSPQNIPRTVESVREAWARLAPHRPFNYRFLDDVFDAQYLAEERFGRVFITFAVLAMLIACLGLFGLATFMVQRRTKEIGIRKVVGASTRSILVLLSKDFSILVTIGVCLASPIVYLAMNRWLEGFAYRVDIPWWLFPAAGVVALLVASITVSIQSLKAASANPVDALKYE